MSTDDKSLSFSKLNDSNYEQWKDDMQALLMQRGVWRIVNESSTCPPDKDSEAKERWHISCDSAAGLIYNCLERSQQTLVKGLLSDPVKMWKELKSIHQKQNATARYNALDQFLNITKDSNESLTSLATRVDEVLQKVQNTHSSALTLTDFEQELAAMVLMHSLPDDYHHL